MKQYFIYAINFLFLPREDKCPLYLVSLFTVPRNRQFQNTKVSKLARSYTNVTCQLLLCWAFGDAFGTVIGSVTFFNFI